MKKITLILAALIVTSGIMAQTKTSKATTKANKDSVTKKPVENATPAQGKSNTKPTPPPPNGGGKGG